MGKCESLKRKAYLEIQEKVPIWVKSGSKTAVFIGRRVIIEFQITDEISPYPHPQGARLWTNGFSHDLINSPLDCLLPSLRSGRSFESRHRPKNEDCPFGQSSFFGRSIGIRTRGLLDPKSPKVEDPILYSPYIRIVSIILAFVNYLVQLVHTVLTCSGLRFGSAKVATPPKSEFSELLWLCHLGTSCREYTILF